MEDISNIVLTARHGTPIYLRDVASVGLGKEQRTGSASRNGEEVVVGTSLMLIGANSRIIRSYVGPYSSIYYDALVENSEIEHSIVLEHARIRDIRRIQDSLIGQRVEVVRSGAKPEAYRIMVGDSSRIEIP